MSAAEIATPRAKPASPRPIFDIATRIPGHIRRKGGVAPDAATRHIIEAASIHLELAPRLSITIFKRGRCQEIKVQHLDRETARALVEPAICR